MRIGRDDNFLAIEYSPPVGGYATLQIEAVATAAGRRFSASHDRLLLDTSDDVKQQFADFEDLKIKDVKIPLSESGWMRFERDARGYIMVHYRIAGWKASAAMEGKIVVEGEFAGTFCREFGALLRPQK
jgi:hypothetical protein